MTNSPSPLASADRRQREQNAAAVSPHSPAAASPSKTGELRPIGLALTAIIAGLPVPKDLVRS